MNFERDTARGMELAENCELTAIAGRTLEKAQQFKENIISRKPMNHMRNFWKTKMWKQFMWHFPIPYIMNGQ